MTEPRLEPITNLIKKRPLPVALIVAALGIALAVYVGNGGIGVGSSCAAQPNVAAAIEQVATGELAALLPTATGRGYSDMAMVDETGREMTIADFAGRPILVNFWATWCVPCREEMPELNALAADYADKEFSVVPVNLDLGADGISKAQAFLNDEKLGNLPLFADPSFGAFERLKANAVALGLPATLLLDSDGCEIAVLQGPAAWNSADGHAVVDALILADANKS